MKYCMFLFYLATCAVGFTAFTISYLLYVRHRKKAILLYALFLGSLGLVVGAFSVWMFAPVFDLKDQPAAYWFSIVGRFFEFLGVTGFIATSCFFFHHLMGVPITRLKRRLFFAAPVISTITYVAWRITNSELLVHGVFLPLVYGISIYGLFIIFSNLPAIGDKTLKRAIKAFLIISGVFLPAYILETSADIIPHFSPPPSYCFSLPTYLFVINSLGILFAVKFFDQPAYMAQGQLTKHFNGRFNISKRESEIIAQVITGLSNREIGNKLCISFKTVENHLYNIYQKTGVRNRVQLTSLIQTNQRD